MTKRKESLFSSLIWIGVLFTSLSWFITTGVYDHMNPLLGYALLIAGMTLCYISSTCTTDNIELKIRIFLITLLTLAALLAKPPFNIGPIMMVAGLIPFCRKWSQKLLGPGVILVVQSILFVVVTTVFTHFHKTYLIQYIVHGFMKLVGANTEFINGKLVLNIGDISTEILCTYEQIGLPIFSMFILSIIVVKALSIIKGAQKFYAITLTVGLLYLLLRYLILLINYQFFSTTQIFWSNLGLITSFFPLAIILGIYTNAKWEYQELSFSWKELKYMLFFYIIIGFCITLLAVEDPGKEKSGRILIDEHHSTGWESVTEPLNTENFGGQRSVYTYYTFRRFLEQWYNVEIASSQNYYSHLNEYDILIVKTPTHPFSEEEVSSIVDFVKTGGGLFLIGDHTNLLNMDTYLNEISSNFGIEFVFDSTFDLRTTFLTEYSPPFFFPHPIVQKIDAYKFATSNTLKIGITVQPLMIGKGLCSDQIDISHVNFFGNMTPDLEDRWGMFVQCAAKKVGKGRVVAFTDSTTFSSFSMMMHDNPLFVLSIIEYLNRTNESYWKVIRICSISAMILITVFMVFTLFRRRNTMRQQIIILLAIVFTSILPVSNALAKIFNDMNYCSQVESKLRNLQVVVFDRQHTNSHLAHFIGVPSTTNEFSSFFIDFQRVGLWPVEAKNIKKFLNKNTLTGLVLVNPDKPFAKSDLREIEKYVSNGGIVLIADSLCNKESTIGMLLNVFGLSYWDSIAPITVEKSSTNNATSVVFVPIRMYSPQKPGIEIQYHVAEAFPGLLLFEIAYKNGKIFLLRDSITLSNAVLGDTAIPPNEMQYRIHQEIFSILIRTFDINTISVSMK